MNKTVISPPTRYLAKLKGFDVNSNTTQAELQTMIRDIYKINASSDYSPNISKYRPTFRPISTVPKHYKSFEEYLKDNYKYYGNTDYDTYEGALEEALQGALNLINNVDTSTTVKSLIIRIANELENDKINEVEAISQLLKLFRVSSMLRRLKNHCDLYGYPSKSFAKRVKDFISKYC